MKLARARAMPVSYLQKHRPRFTAWSGLRHAGQWQHEAHHRVQGSFTLSMGMLITAVVYSDGMGCRHSRSQRLGQCAFIAAPAAALSRLESIAAHVDVNGPSAGDCVAVLLAQDAEQSCRYLQG